jgi:hypothetical protein
MKTYFGLVIALLATSIVAIPASQAGTCVDKATDCSNKKSLCNDPKNKSVLLKNCKKTCGFCKEDLV